METVMGTVPLAPVSVVRLSAWVWMCTRPIVFFSVVSRRSRASSAPAGSVRHAEDSSRSRPSSNCRGWVSPGGRMLANAPSRLFSGSVDRR